MKPEQERMIREKHTDSDSFLHLSSLTWCLLQNENVWFFFLFVLLQFYFVVFVCSRDSFLCCALGKRLRMPGHRRRRGGGLGRERRCSRVQRRPRHETSRQGGPGRSCSLLWCVPYKHMWRIRSHVSVQTSMKVVFLVKPFITTVINSFIAPPCTLLKEQFAFN